MLPHKKPSAGIPKNTVANFDLKIAYEELQQENIKLKQQLLDANVSTQPGQSNSPTVTEAPSSTSPESVFEKKGTLVHLRYESITEGFLWIGKDWIIKQMNEEAERSIMSNIVDSKFEFLIDEHCT